MACSERPGACLRRRRWLCTGSRWSPEGDVVDEKQTPEIKTNILHIYCNKKNIWDLKQIQILVPLIAVQCTVYSVQIHNSYKIKKKGHWVNSNPQMKGDTLGK